MKKRVFLGGTCNGSKWRDWLIPCLDSTIMGFFNPVMEDSSLVCREEEIKQRESCDYILYTITPKMVGVYDIAEVVDDSNKRPEKTILCTMSQDGTQEFSKEQWISILSVASMVENNGVRVFLSIYDAADYLNGVRK